MNKEKFVKKLSILSKESVMTKHKNLPGRNKKTQIKEKEL